jgi:hypothetical protein
VRGGDGDLHRHREATARGGRAMSGRAYGLAMLVGACLLACAGNTTDNSNFARGRGLSTTALPPAAEAGAVDAAIRAAFDVDPSLVLMVHPRRLPRMTGYDGGDSLPSALRVELRRRGLVQGSCEPHHDAPRDTPRCLVPQAGYVVRISDVFQGKGDTLQMNFAAEKFAAAHGLKPEALRFEKIYQLERESTGWRVVREARVHDEP